MENVISDGDFSFLFIVDNFFDLGFHFLANLILESSVFQNALHFSVIDIFELVENDIIDFLNEEIRTLMASSDKLNFFLRIVLFLFLNSGCDAASFWDPPIKF